MVSEQYVSVTDEVPFRTSITLSDYDDGVYRAHISYDHRNRLDQIAFGQGGRNTGIYAERSPETEKAFDFYRVMDTAVLDQFDFDGYIINRTEFEADQIYTQESFSTDTELVNAFLGELSRVMCRPETCEDRYTEFITTETVSTDVSVPTMYRELFS